MSARTYVAGTADELYAVLAGLDRRTCDVLFVIPDHGLAVNRSIIISVAHVPEDSVLCPDPDYISDGGLMSLFPDQIGSSTSCRVLCRHPILRGTPPSELPIEEPSKALLSVQP